MVPVEQDHDYKCGGILKHSGIDSNAVPLYHSGPIFVPDAKERFCGVVTIEQRQVKARVYDIRGIISVGGDLRRC